MALPLHSPRNFVWHVETAVKKTRDVGQDAPRLYCIGRRGEFMALAHMGVFWGAVAFVSVVFR